MAPVARADMLGAPREVSVAAGAVLASALSEMIGPLGSVVVCGAGWIADAMDSLVDVVTVVEYSSDGEEVLEHADVVVVGDEPFPDFEAVYDVAVCVGWVEKLPSERAKDVVEWLARSAGLVVFAAPAPGDEGAVDAKPPAGWVDLFSAGVDAAVSNDLRWLLWDDPRVEPWVVQNLLMVGEAEWLVDCGLVLGPPVWVRHPGENARITQP